MEFRSRGDGVVRQPPFPGAPVVEVLFGGDENGPDVGLVRVDIPPGAGMPEHDHGGSDVILVPIVGTVEVTKGDEAVSVGVGDTLLVRKEERVALRNPTDTTAHVVVAAAPTTFVTAIRCWPALVEA